MILETVLLLTFVLGGTFLIFDFQNLTSINSDTFQTGKTNQAVKTAESADIIYTTVHFASSR